ncbi:hypothetical protein SCP_0210630 [Sparassis crispa]|uniref:Mitochondrial distribution and morphology protein 34 n=1 Tax=Sparassis crispa TaxID=139825 RepID=A0A401GCJ3_9APHY|nr:hypothetical protein SCP_0210630 [Sparassis crispa]GBE79861.1 hypothetical protein SCP_0210630 [Sparassis crispa]
MSFTFKWPRFSDQFHADAIQMLDAALNKGNKPPVIADKIEVVELEMGTQPPELEIRDVGELTMDQFRGIFRLTYAGDAHIVLRTKANPLNHKQPDIDLMAGSTGMLAAKNPLVVPMLLRLSHFKLNSYVVLVVSRQKGITLVFKTDPLQNVDINSTFDSIAVIQKFIQREIEDQLRQMFREDLPGIIHRLSQQWVKAKVEAPYLKPASAPPQWSREMAYKPDFSLYRPLRMSSIGLQSPGLRSPFLRGVAGFDPPRSASVYSSSSAGRSRRPAPSSASPPTSVSVTPISAPVLGPPAAEDPTSFPEIEHFDPTYGLRPEGLPAKSMFGGFRSLFAAQRKGLADLAEEPSDIDDTMDSSSSFGVANWEDLLSDYNHPSEVGDVTEYESVPAVGGGTITRPRVIHSQSQIHPPDEAASAAGTPGPARRPLPSRSSISAPVLCRPSLSLPLPSSSRSDANYNPYFAGATPLYDGSALRSELANEAGWAENPGESSRSASMPPVPPLEHYLPRRPGSSSSLQTQPSSDMTHSIPTPPEEDETGVHIRRPRRLSLTSLNMDRFGSPPDPHMLEQDPKIVLRPTLNNSVSKLSTLTHSNHTLSPYTRTLEHFTVRSVPPREQTSSGPVSSVEKPPVKAKRKRTHRLGGKLAKPPEDVPVTTSPPQPPTPGVLSDFDASEMDRYFRSRDDLIPRFPTDQPPSPSHGRRRLPYQT